MISSRGTFIVGLATAALWVATSASVRTLATSGLTSNGTGLTVTTSHTVATFAKADLVGFTNLLTGENYLTHPSTGGLASVDTVVFPNQFLTASNWNISFDGTLGTNVATITLNDSNRTMTVGVWIDPVSDEIVLRHASSVSSPGLRGSTWAMAGVNVQNGRLIVPSRGGQVIDESHTGIGTDFSYPQAWQAQMFVYEGASGSALVYSTDAGYWFKRLRMSTRGSHTIDVAIGTDATGSYAAATFTPQIQWRLKSFAGNWQVAAAAYRTWLNNARPPVSTANYPWVNDIRAVVLLHGLDTNVLTSLATKLVPSQTLIYLGDWRSDPFDVDYPDYTPAASAPAYVAMAKGLGFRVMLHTDLIGVSPTSPDYPSVQAYHARDPETLQHLGWLWHLPPSTPNRFATINPAAAAFRSLLVSRLGVAVSALQPDALHLDISSPMWNDAAGLIEGRNYPAGSAKLHEEIATAFPNVALMGEGENDVIYRYHRFAQMLTYVDTYGNEKAAPGHPISTFLFSPSVQFTGHFSIWKPAEFGFKSMFEDTITRGSMPLLKVENTGDLDTSNPDTARMVSLLLGWQTGGYQLATSGWQSDLVRWTGNAGITGSLTNVSGLYDVTLNGASAVQLLRGPNQLTSPRFIRSWPAFDSTRLYGLEPRNFYWIDPIPRSTSTHVTSLPAGVRIGASTLIGSGFSHFELLPPETTAFSAESQLLQAQLGARYLGVDGPFTGGAEVRVGNITVGGQTRSGLFIHPPPQGETFAEYQVTVPTPATLRFGVGVDDNANCTDGVTFRVTANGAQLFSQHYLRGAWHDEAVDLSAYSGSTIALRIISNAGPVDHSNCDWSLWNNARIETVPSGKTITVPVTLAPGQSFAGLLGNGLAAIESPSTIQVSNVPLPGRFTILNVTGTLISAGTALTSVPWQSWLQPHGYLAEPGTYFGGGTISAGTAGGQFRNPTLNGNPPFEGALVMSWLLRLPAGGPLRFNWSGSMLDGNDSSDGAAMEVRINGVTYWRHTTSGGPWVPGSLDLSPWQGQTILLELVTDSIRQNFGDWPHWADLGFSSGAACSYSFAPTAPIGAAGGTFSLNITTSSTCPWSPVSNQPWLTLGSPSAGIGSVSLTYSVAPNLGAARTATLTIGGQLFTVTQSAGSPEAVSDPAFSGGFNVGLAGWKTFALPDASYLVANVSGGIVNFHRVPPPAQQIGQATVFQNTFMTVPSGSGLEAQFDLGNSSTVRKRMSVLLIESDFSDISVCTFWLPASSPLRTYRMRTHTTKAWTNASIYFYAATAGSDGGSYRLANVSLHSNPALASDRTDCVDALAPAPAAVADGPELLKNGRFDTGTTSDWSLFGQIVSQVSGGVFEFYRPQASPDPAGVILQPTGVPLAAGDVLTAQFDLGNSSNVRKRVTVLLHDNSFLDLHACTFWLAPGQPLSSYQMRSYATQAWTNATISIYAASAGDPAWMRLDNVSLRKTSSVTTVGADCLEPGSTDIGAAPASEGAGVANESLDGVLVFRRAEARRLREL